MKKFAKDLSLVVICLLFLGTGKIRSQCTASFVYSVGSNGAVSFTSTSVGTNSALTTYYWNFGNSTFTSGIGVTTPSATYTSNGTYTVSLTFTVPCVSNTTAIITITNVAGCSLNAGLNYGQGSSGFVNFGNTSTGTVPGTTYTLDYGDASPVSSTFASHTYSANGTYTATLMASNNSTPACTSTNTFVVNVTSYCSFTAGFTHNVGINGLVSFQSTSTGTTSSNYYKWYFGDGSPMVNGTNLVSPTHTYANGTYTAQLSVQDNSFAPTCTMVTQQVITVTTNTCNLSASYTYTMGSNGLVNFSNTSTGTISGTTYFWNFDDGTTSTAVSPSHTYNSSGPYTVTLTVTSASNCINSYAQLVNVTTAPCTANAGFSIAPTSTAQVWTATPSFPWNVVAALWNWGDGSTSWGMYSQHTYSASATYSICLTVTVSCGATASSCSAYFIFKPSQSMQMIQVNVVEPTLVPVGIEAFNVAAAGFDIYPNPNNGDFKLELTAGSEPVQIMVYSVAGSLLYENTYANERMIRLENIPSGIYVVKVKSGDYIQTRKMIINN